FPEAEIDEAGDLAGVAELIRRDRGGYDLALLDLTPSGTADLDGLTALRSHFPKLPVLIVTTIDEPCVIRAALRLGISGV
ncbi:DNA-binding response regulator, partial [Mycobacterium tuberculosis]|nr:DNA-binding response regulator [Mycobacterium tuberculosis]